MTPARPGKSAAWLPPKWEIHDLAAIQSLARGDATPDQQRYALTMIVEKLASTYDLSYRPESDRDTCFAEGRRFVGLQIVKLTKIDIKTFKEKTK